MADVMDLAALVPERHWVCPNCTATAATKRNEPHTEFHHCPGLAGLWAPMVEAGVEAKVEAIERADYINGEDIRYDDNGRPIMAALTTRDDGADLAVYAPTAHGGAGI